VPSDPQADDYRRRAIELRRLANHLETTPLLSLHRWAEEDTWSSPRADECRDLLIADQSRVRRAVDDLRDQAWWYERQADHLDAAAAARALIEGR
jgi:hypothetical protein